MKLNSLIEQIKGFAKYTPQSTSGHLIQGNSGQEGFQFDKTSFIFINIFSLLLEGVFIHAFIKERVPLIKKKA